jgi:hypothetical protein
MQSVMQQATPSVEARSVRSHDLRIIVTTALVIVLAFVAIYALSRESGPDRRQLQAATAYP